MEMNDSVVSGWLEGGDSVDGLANPAGPLYVEGFAAVEAALSADMASCCSIGGMTGVTGTSCSYRGGCCCC